MSVQWHYFIDGETVVLRARMEAKMPDGSVAIGDARREIGPDDNINIANELTYEALINSGGGIIDVADDGSFEITPTE